MTRSSSRSRFFIISASRCLMLAAVLAVSCLENLWSQESSPVPALDYSEEMFDSSGSGDDESSSSSSGNGYGDDMAAAQENGLDVPDGQAGLESPELPSAATALTSMFGDMDLGPLFLPPEVAPKVVEGPVLFGEAEAAYRAGHYPLALELYFAHMAAEYDDAHVRLKTVKFSKYLRRPVWQIRWGVSFTVRGDSVDPSPIIPGKTLKGNKQRGGYGNEYDEGSSDGGSPSGGRPSGGRPSGGSPTSGDEGMDDGGGEPHRNPPPAAVTSGGSARKQIDSHLGLVAAVMGMEFSTRYRQGDFGPALIEVSPTGDRPTGDVASLLAQSPPPPEMWIPGVIFLGKGDVSDMVSAAVAERIDMLLHFDVTVKSQRSEDIQNISRCRLIPVTKANAEKPRAIAMSKGMDSFEAIKLATTGRGDEKGYIKDQLSSLLLQLDRNLKTIDMPRLTPEVAKRRIVSLLSGANARSLRTLAEVRLYQAQELLTQEEVETIFDIVGGQEGLTLLHGETSEKLKVARDWAIRSLPESK